MRQPAEILAEWQRHIDAMAEAAGQRNYDFFFVAYRDGNRCYEELHAIMESNLRSKEWREENRDAIVAVTRAWVARCDEIGIWMKEIADEAKTVRRTQSAERKLAGAYSHIRKSGNNLRLSR